MYNVHIFIIYIFNLDDSHSSIGDDIMVNVVNEPPKSIEPIASEITTEPGPPSNNELTFGSIISEAPIIIENTTEQMAGNIIYIDLIKLH